MASTVGDLASLTPEQLRTVDQARQRLDQLTKSIESVRHAVLLNAPMPTIASLQSHANILVQTTTSITSHLSTHADLLATLVAYPSTNYPGRTQEGLAGQLLRKKLEPNVESWVDKGRAVGKEAVEEEKMKDEDLEKEWYQAAAWTAGEAKKFMEESEARGEDLDDEEMSDEDEDVEMGGQAEDKQREEEAVGGKAEPGRPEMSVAQMARFMNTGIMP